ncbi:MAG TPA: hypothetical protein DEB40_05435 [Elusimicrobia bacterium]|nr:hypothetical protein [Elusimicrobiota bacterium]HBT61167.1 hypothetical protein [Elusimicrobiota bacterium]
MNKSLLVCAAAVMISALTASRAAEPAKGAMINLSCLEALVTIDQAGLSGVFSFIAEKDSAAAFADLVVHNGKALKRYVGKLEKDFKGAGGVTGWDHDVLVFALQLYSSPLAETLEKPHAKLMTKMTDMSMAPTMSLEQVTARRKKS